MSLIEPYFPGMEHQYDLWELSYSGDPKLVDSVLTLEEAKKWVGKSKKKAYSVTLRKPNGFTNQKDQERPE